MVRARGLHKVWCYEPLYARQSIPKPLKWSDTVAETFEACYPYLSTCWKESSSPPLSNRGGGLLERVLERRDLSAM